MQEQSKLIQLKAFTRPAWMNDGQYSLCVEMKKVSEAMFEAMLAREHEKWLQLSLRMREITRMAYDHMLIDPRTPLGNPVNVARQVAPVKCRSDGMTVPGPVE